QVSRVLVAVVSEAVSPDGAVGGVVSSLLPPVRPKNSIAYRAMPPWGRLCPAPWMLYASTWPEPYRLRFQPGCGVSVLVGVWLRPCTFVHCSIDSRSSEYGTSVSAVPCQSWMRGRGPV